MTPAEQNIHDIAEQFALPSSTRCPYCDAGWRWHMDMSQNEWRDQCPTCEGTGRLWKEQT